MRKHLHSLFQYSKYRFLCKTAHGIHSPQAFELYGVIHDHYKYPAYAEVENYRKLMLNSRQMIKVADHGAGTKFQSNSSRQIGRIASTSLKSKKYGQLLYRLVNHFKPKVIIELGTSLGISTMYLAHPDKQAKVITLEGSSEIAALARSNFGQAGFNNIELLEGKFKDTLSDVFKSHNIVDMIFIDGHHLENPTIEYATECLNHVNNDSVIIIDDIHWSDGMQKAWKTICLDKRVTMSIDLFEMGIIFVKKGLPRQNIVICF